MPDEDRPELRQVVGMKITLPTIDDITRGSAIGADVCPRRYCFLWDTHSFDWEKSPSQGSTILQRGKPPGWLLANVPCSRAEPWSPIDHFEPNEPALEQDGVDSSAWEASCEQSRERVRTELHKRLSSQTGAEG